VDADLRVSVEPTALVGAWDLVSWDLAVDGAPRPHGFGDEVTGQLLYLADGHMSAILSDPNRPELSAEPLAAAPADERAEAARAYVSYGGSWSVRGDEVVHHVAFCLLPNWVGTDLVRTVTWHDGQLVLSTAPELDAKGRTVTNRLVWRRCAPA
jgi:hypothetical protein